jgi:hypothetical protein
LFLFSAEHVLEASGISVAPPLRHSARLQPRSAEDVVTSTAATELRQWHTPEPEPRQHLLVSPECESNSE